MATVKEGYSLVKVTVISEKKGTDFYYQAVKDGDLKIGSEYFCDLAGKEVRVRVIEMDIDPAEIMEKPWILKELYKVSRIKKVEPTKRELPPGVVEEWRPIYGYEGIYEISNTGRVRSIDRRDKNGVLRKGRELKVRWDDYFSEYIVSLSKDGKTKSRSIGYLTRSSFPPKDGPINSVSKLVDDQNSDDGESKDEQQG